jgi:YHS domain-containing protein
LFACGAGAPATPAAAEVLAAADQHDGAADHVVSECTGCSLGMPGDAAHAATHEGYTLHFCSDSCKSAFEADPAAGVSRLAAVVK